ncbi:MAG: amino acid adenylation domain-containing protein [Cyanobacteria bacterium P01_F01_bin.86]
MCNLFSSVLTIENIGIDDNFFELGGHSLLATQLISRLREAFSLDIPLRELFTSPTVAQLASAIAELQTPQQAAKKTGQQKGQQKGQQTGHPPLTLPRIQPRNQNQSLPLSWAQERLWFIDRLEGEKATYNLPFTVRITGELDSYALQQALSEIVRRHEVTRTSFQTVDETPIQVIHPEATLSIDIVDLQDLDTREKENSVIQQAQREASTPFNLKKAPLIRCRLLQLEAREYVLLLTMHHIISDGWSMGVLIQEIYRLYPVFCANEPSPLAELPIQYADFALWQRQHLSGATLEAQLDYWKQQLEGAPELLQLPTDRPRPNRQTNCGKTQRFTLNAALTQKIKMLTQKSGTTLFMTLHAAFSALLYRYSSQSDILVGSPIANRNHSEIEGLIGFFVNTLVMRTRFSNNPSFKQLLTQVREMMLRAYENQDVPFERVVEALQPERSLSYSPLCQVMFALQNAPTGNLDLSDLAFEFISQESTVAKFDLTLSMTETEGTLLGEWEYNVDLFDPATIERMAGNFQTLLEAIVENPDCHIAELPLLSAREQHQLLMEWNNTQQDYPQDKCLYQLFEAQVAKAPDAVAVVFEGEQLTYKELNHKANQLARYLQSLGVKPEVLVGICVERSHEMMIGLLGILKAGGAYVPLDPSYPQDRLNYMLDDASVEVLVTQQSLLDSLPVSKLNVVCLDRDWHSIAQQGSCNLNAQTTPDDLAYVIYTSGSTGQPKGVQVCHKSLVNFLQSMSCTPGLTQADTLYAVTTICFDIAALELYLPLVVGAKVIVGSRESITNGEVLLSALSKFGVTVMQATPATWHMLLAAGWSNHYPLKVLCGGEALSGDLIRHILETGSQLWNMYGPTETTIWSTTTKIEASKTENVTKEAIASIGRPIANTQLYILDPQFQPVPIGVPGELYIGGNGLAKGYLNRPELTQEKFISVSFKGLPSPAEILYKTGDLARYLPDGNVNYLGRIDHQAKVRGFRIELGEIEVALNTHPQIQQTVVIAREDDNHIKGLIAYIVSSAPVTSTQLRQHLKSQLPDYMLPNAFVTLERFPLTPNGKIDRKALPAPNISERTADCVAPRTPSEEIIANIFASVLKVDKIGIHDNFFELGGHSLLATQLISRVREALALDVPLRALFESPTVAELERAIAPLKNDNNSLAIPVIQPRGESADLALSFAQERLWFLDRLAENSTAYNMPGVFRIVGDLNIEALQQTLQAVVSRHEVLCTRFETKNGTPAQIIEPDTKIEIKLINLQDLDASKRDQFVLESAQNEATTPFDLAQAPLMRCRLLKLTTHDYVLLLTMHHIASDGWSMGLLIKEVSSLYQAFSQGAPSPLAALPIQYADFALWQRKYVCGARLETQLNYWKQQLSGTPELLQLPTDRPRPNEQTHSGTTQQFRLSKDLTQQINELSQKSGTTLFMTLQAAFSTLLHRYSGQLDICVGSPIANRNHSELEELIGFFTNTLVLRSRFEEDLSFEQLLSQVRETTLEAYGHQDVPFERIVEALQPERSLSHAPLFQTMFVLQNAPEEDIELPGLTLSQLELETSVSKFDLTLFVTETASGLVGNWEYSTDLFDASTIERMAGHFQNLLEAIVENPAQQVSALPLLSTSERDRLLIDWNETTTDYLTDHCIHELFEQQAANTPDKIAVVFEGKQLTYQTLNQKANQLARHLQSLSVKPETLVGICIDRSIEMVIGLLGILKSGGAYVPLDPNYPAERLSHMLTDSGVEVVLTQQSLKDSLPPHMATVVYLDKDDEAISRYPSANIDSKVTSDNLAYVIYTSGSTGNPKGVAITHKSTATLCLWGNNTFSQEQLSGVLASTSICFDLSVFEIFVTLSGGGAIILAENALELPAVRSSVPITLLNTVPSAARELLRMDGIPETINTVNLAGEALPQDLVDKLYQQVHIKKVYNLYGPSEDTTYSTFTLTKEKQNTPPTIGKAIAHTKTYILDKFLQPVPIGIPGELYIGGNGVARGYLNRPELTEERFIPNPFSSQREDRLYKTGDLTRYLSDGDIEYLGRIDHQVKIRGFRIELGEIQSALTTHPMVVRAVVIVREDNGSHRRLVAYIVSHAPFTCAQLRAHLKAQLPDYMIPAVFVSLENLPLTPNGKLDRKALPAPETIEQSSEGSAPRTPQEQHLVTIWQELLPVKSIGIHDNFFEMGGDSILSIQVISRAKNVGLQISAKQIFQYQTIAELANVAMATVKLDCQQGVVIGNAPLTPIQRWFVTGQTAPHHHFNQSVLLQVPSEIEADILQQALSEVLEHHDALRLHFTREGEDYRQTNLELDLEPQGKGSLAVIDLSNKETEEQENAIKQISTEFQVSLNISTGDMMKIVLFKLGDDLGSRLLIIIHQLVIDGVSWQILLEDLETTYQQLISHTPVQLSSKTTAFIDWAKRLNEYGRSQTLTQELDYWMTQPWSMASSLPLDYADRTASNTVGDAQNVSVKLSQSDTTALLESVNEAYNTQINDILLSALGLAFVEWTGQSKILINLEGHGREDIFDDVDISRTVGSFTSLFPLLLDLPEEKNIEAIIKSTKEQLRAIPNHGIGFGLLRYLSSSDVMDRVRTIPTPDIAFNYLGHFDQIQSKSGWKAASESIGENSNSHLNRSQLLEIKALIIEGELRIDWTYSGNFHRRGTIEGLAQRYLSAIRSIIEHCQKADHSGYTPSDFPNANLDQAELDELLESFDVSIS